MTQPLRIALLGAGTVAQTYLDVIASNPAVATLAAVAEPDPSRMRAVVDRFGVEGFHDLHELLDVADTVGVEAVIVCTPPVTHATLSAAALERKMAVLCEKPMAPNRPGLHMMLDAAERSGARLMMASTFRYAADVRAAKTLIDDGVLGDVVLFRASFSTPVAMRGRWNARPEISGGGVIIDAGTHAVDVVRYLLGPIRNVVAAETRRLQGLPVEDTAQLMLRTEGGASGTVDVSWSLHATDPWYLTIEGTKASLRLGWESSELHLGTGWERFGNGFDRVAAFTGVLTDFVDSVRFGKEPIIDAADARASVAVIDAAYRSIQTGSWVRVVEERRSQSRG